MSQAPLPCICPCDCDLPAAPTNPPGLSTLNYRAGTFAEFRRALLLPRPGETQLSAWEAGAQPGDTPTAVIWRPGAQGDLALMMVEWWAYLADILTFYNERHANQQYLGAADLPGAVNRLIRLLGYRPQPALGARATIAALVQPGRSAVLPRGLQFQSKPGPGQEPQTFELDADTAISAPDLTPALPPQGLLAPDPALLLLNGSVSSIHAGDHLLLRPRDGSAPSLITVSGTATETLVDRSKQTRLKVAAKPVLNLSAAAARLERPSQSSGLWGYHPDYAMQQDPGLINTVFGGVSYVSSQPAYVAYSYQASSSGQHAYSAQQSYSAQQNAQIFSGYQGFTQILPDQIHLAGLARQIRPGELILLTAPGLDPVLLTVTGSVELIWYANATGYPGTQPAATTPPIGIPHTRLSISPALNAAWAAAAAKVTVWFGWAEAAKLKDQPLASWSGTPASLRAIAPAHFRKGSNLPLLISDSTGAGAAGKGGSAGDDLLTLSGLDDPFPALKPPFEVLFNLLPVSRGKTVAREVLGSGQATIAGQSFTLGKSPVTYLRQGSGYASTIRITVDGHPWREVESFYGQAPEATVFTTREDELGRTIVSFGDGVNGARLPTGQSNVVASYRTGGGAASPGVGQLSVIAQSFPGLKAVRNPVAASGGADPDPPAKVRRYAPRSVLTFGRAVSAADFQAIAAQAAGGARVRAVWAWDEARQRATVVVHVGADLGVVGTVRTTLRAAGDPNRPVGVVQAKPLPVALSLTLRTVAGMDTAVIEAGLRAALTGEDGLFAAARLGIGQSLFDSRIAAACLAVDGVEAIVAQTFRRQHNSAFVAEPGPVHATQDDGVYFELADGDLDLILQGGGDGG